MLYLVTQLCPILCSPMDCSPPGSSVCGDSPGNNTGVGCHALLQGIFLTQESNPGLPHCRWILYYLSHQGKSYFAYIDFSLKKKKIGTTFKSSFRFTAKLLGRWIFPTYPLSPNMGSLFHYQHLPLEWNFCCNWWTYNDIIITHCSQFTLRFILGVVYPESWQIWHICTIIVS